MNRILCCTLAFLLLVLVPAASLAEEGDPAPVPVEKNAAVLVDQAGIVGKTFSQGEQVSVKAEQDGYYWIESDDGDLLVEKWLIRMDSETAPAAYTAYARGNTDIYPDVYLEGEKLVTLSVNTQLTVEDSFGTVLRITLKDGSTGFVRASEISRSPIVYGGGGGGGNDGGEIPLASLGHPEWGIVRLFSTTRQEGEAPFVTGIGTVVADGVEGYVVLLSRGDTVYVKERIETICTVQANETTGSMPMAMLSFEDDPTFEDWNGYAQKKAPLHRHWRMLDEETELDLNTPVHVIGMIGDRCIVEVDDILGFISMDKVSKNPITYGGGGGEWTDPVL